MPGMTKICSMMTAPPISSGACSPIKRDNRDQRVAQRVAGDDQLLAQALGPGSADVVLAQHLQHHGARQPHGDGRQRRARG